MTNPSLFPAFRVMRRRGFWSYVWFAFKRREFLHIVKFAGQAFDQERRAIAACGAE